MAGLVIRKAQRSKSHLKLVIDGVSGSGKTYSALLIAKGIGPDPRVLLIDTENGSGELYSHLYEYDYIRLSPPYSPAKYVAAILAAVDNGNNVIIIDSLTHCWKYILSYKESLDAANPKAGFTNWAKAKLLFDEVKTALLQCPTHVIACLRAGSEYAESYDSRGNKKFDKVGTKPIAEPDLEYEFTLALRIERSHLATATKDRTERFDIAAPFTPSPTTGNHLYSWLMEGSGELSITWAGALHGEEAKRALSEADRLGIGVEGSTDDDLSQAATELLRQKQREANATIKEIGLDKDRVGMKTFSEKSKAEGLDPLELFWEFTKKGQGMTTWAEFQLLLEAYVAAKNETEGKVTPNPKSPPSDVKSSDEEPSQTSTDSPKTRTEPEPETEESRASEAPAKQEARTVSSGPSSQSSLWEEYRKSKDKEAILKRADRAKVDIADLITEIEKANPKARLVDVVAALDEAEGRN